MISDQKSQMMMQYALHMLKVNTIIALKFKVNLKEYFNESCNCYRNTESLANTFLYTL